MKTRKLLSIMECFTLIVVTCLCMLFSVGCSRNEPKKEADGSLVITPDEVQVDTIIFLTKGPSANLTDYTLSAVFNEDCPVSMQLIDWSIAWKNFSSEWATGKVVTDYIKLTPDEVDLTAEVELIAAFGEQIIVTAASRICPEIEATATIDYLKRDPVISIPDITLGDCLGTPTFNYDNSVGTLTPTNVRVDRLTFSYNDSSIKSKVDSINSTLGSQYTNVSACFGFVRRYDSSDSDYIRVSSLSFVPTTDFSIESFLYLSALLSDTDKASVIESTEYKLAYNEALNFLTTNSLPFVLNYTVYYNSRYCFSANASVTLKINQGSVTPLVFVTSLSLDDNSVIF